MVFAGGLQRRLWCLYVLRSLQQRYGVAAFYHVWAHFWRMCGSIFFQLDSVMGDVEASRR